MQMPYIGPNNGSNFHPADLRDVNGNEFGTVHLCARSDLVASLPTLVGPAFPGPVIDPISFPEVFTWLANQVGKQLNSMNLALFALHNKWMSDGKIDDAAKDTYIAAATSILVVLGIMRTSNHNQKNLYWPLVPINDGNEHLPLGETLASTRKVKNRAFPNKPIGAPSGPPDHTEAFYFPISVPKDKIDATGRIVFYQDAEWAPDAKVDTEWSSWGYITNFELTLIESDSSSVTRLAAVATVSSSSSSYYAASSKMPNN